jgi:NADH-quinone oxidoreductase subunit F
VGACAAAVDRPQLLPTIPAVKAPLLLTRPHSAPTETLAEYRARGGYQGLERALLANSPDAVLDSIEQSGLRGRGGASFPTARKWRLAAAQNSADKFVVANGGEHEPGSEKDRHLVALYPHAMIEGLVLAGFATGASKGYVYLIEDMHAQVASVERAVAELHASRLLAGTPFGRTFAIEIHKAPTTYVAGEETAALNSIEGKPAKPRKKPPFPGEQGLFGKPTTINNVETLAHAAWIARAGAAAFAAIGTAESKGTLLFTLPAEMNRPGVYELPFGSTYRHLLDECGGGTRDGSPVRAVLPALSCGFLLAEHLDTKIAYETLRPLGTSPGCGGVRLVTPATDVVALALEIATFFMKEQCGQCPACRMETNQFVHILKGVQQGMGPGYQEKLQKLADFNRKKGFCSLIEMAAAPVLSAVQVFAADFARSAGPKGQGDS